MADDGRGLSDPRNPVIDEYVMAAEQAERNGNVRAAGLLYALAAELETRVYLDTPADQPRLRAIIGRSAETLWKRAIGK